MIAFKTGALVILPHIVNCPPVEVIEIRRQGKPIDEATQVGDSIRVRFPNGDCRICFADPVTVLQEGAA